MDNKNSNFIIDFGSTLEAYDKILSYLITNKDTLNLTEEHIKFLKLYETFMFQLAINEINSLRRIVRIQYDSYNSLLGQVDKYRDIINELIKKVENLNKSDLLNKDTSEITKTLEEKSSFLNILKDKLSKFFKS